MFPPILADPVAHCLRHQIIRRRHLCHPPTLLHDLEHNLLLAAHQNTSPGLLHEESGGLLHRPPYEHQSGVRRDQHGRAQPPPHSRWRRSFIQTADHSIRRINSPNIYASMVSALRWAGPVCVGTMPGPSHSTPHRGTNEYTPHGVSHARTCHQGCHVLDRADITITSGFTRGSVIALRTK